MLNLLLVTLGAAWITERAGLSLALGAFVAGMLIAETQYKHQVEEDIKPFRDVLLGLFFITIGMLLNLQLVLAQLVDRAGLAGRRRCCSSSRLIAGAGASCSARSAACAMRTGLALAQAGEFGFVLLNLASGNQADRPVPVQLVLAGDGAVDAGGAVRDRPQRPDRDEAWRPTNGCCNRCR